MKKGFSVVVVLMSVHTYDATCGHERACNILMVLDTGVKYFKYVPRDT